MLLVENVPQPLWLVGSGEADARKARLHVEASRRTQCRWVAAAVGLWSESVFQL
jgi:hypothetical protein